MPSLSLLEESLKVRVIIKIALEHLFSFQEVFLQPKNKTCRSSVIKVLRNSVEFRIGADTGLAFALLGTK